MSGNAKTVFGKPSIRRVFGSTLKPSMSSLQATVALTVPSFAHQRMPGNSIRANSTVVADEINSANDYPVATLSICVDLEAEIAAKMYKLGDLWQCGDCMWTTRYSQEILGLGALTAAILPETNTPCPFILKASMLNRLATPAPSALSFAHPEMLGTCTRVDTIKASDFRL